MDLKDYKKKFFEFCDYVPHSGQMKLHFSEKPDARFRVAICGRRWGKSVSASQEAAIIVTQPKKRVWVVAPTYDGSEKVFREVWHKLVVEKQMPTTRASFKQQYIEFEWGSTIEGKSADKPDSLVGEGLDYLIIDECAKIKEKVWNMYLRPTLSDRKGKALFITTPQGYNWIYQLYLRGFKDDMWESINSPSWENQYAYPEGEKDEDLLEARRNMPIEVFEQEYGAKFCALAGRVYPFDRDKDIGEYPYDPDLPTYCSIDFGYRMPSVLWFQTSLIDGKDHVYVIDEINHQRNIKTDKLVQMVKSKPYRIDKFFGDPAGKNVQGSSGMGDMEIFRRAGIRVHSVRDKVSRKLETGITLVRSFIENADGERFLHLDRKCIGLQEDLENYRFPEHAEGKQLKSEPIKDGLHDHGCDALRYFFLNRFPIRQNSINFISR